MNKSFWYRHRLKAWHVFLIPFCLIWVYPFIWMISAAFKSQREMLLGGLSLSPRMDLGELPAGLDDREVRRLHDEHHHLLGHGRRARPARVRAGRVRVGPKDLPGKKVIVGVLVVTMFIPHGYTIIPTFLLVNGMGLNNGLLGATLAQAGPALVVPVLLFMGFFGGIPRELEEAARIDGAGYPGRLPQSCCRWPSR